MAQGFTGITSSGGATTFWVASEKADIFVNTITFTNAGENTTAIYTPDRVLRITQSSVNSGNPFYGQVVESSFSTNTTVTILAQFDLANEALEIDLCNEVIKTLQYSDRLTVITDASNAVGAVILPEDAQIIGGRFRLETAPTGSASTATVDFGGSNYFTSALSVPDAGNDSAYQRASTLFANAWDEVEFYFDSVGSTTPGGSPYIVVFYIPDLWTNLT